jgi:hypothetical protein
MEYETSSFPSISTPVDEKSLEDFSHLFSDQKTASPPLFSNIVLKTIHNAEINLEVLFNILPVVKLSPDDIKKIVSPAKDSDEDTLKIEYFNELFISVRKFPKARGYRLPCKIKSFLDLDFFFSNRNFHMKVSANKVAIIGGGSLDISERLLKTIYHHLITYNDNWMSFKDLTRDQINDVSDKFIKQVLPVDDEELRFYNVLESIIDRNQEDVMERLRDINPIMGIPLFKKIPEFTSLLNCNSVFNYRLPEEICLADKTTLLKKLGYKVIYHNYIIVKCLKATWIDAANNIKFSFSIQNIGTIKQNSSHNYEDNIWMYEKLVTDLGYIPYSKGSEYIKKPKTQPLENIIKSSKCSEIISEYLGIT